MKFRSKDPSNLTGLPGRLKRSSRPTLLINTLIRLVEVS